MTMIKGEGLRRQSHEQVGTLSLGCRFAGALREVHEIEAQLGLTRATQEGPKDGTRSGRVLMRVGQSSCPEVLTLSSCPHCNSCQNQMVQ